MQNLTYVLLLGIVLVLSFYLRIKPNLYHNRKIGIDIWYWLLYIKNLSEKHGFSIKIDNYLLDSNEQCYPPLFPILISKLGEKRIRKYGYLIAPLIDCFQLFLLVLVAFLLTQNIALTLIAGLVYAIMPILITYNFQLNPRSLGSLFFSIVFLSVLLIELTNNYYFLLAIILFGVLVLFTHKMTTQIMVVFLLSYSVITLDLVFVAVVPIIFFFAIVFSKGFYLKILRGHYDIVTFWKRNINYLRAHQINDSFLYKREEKVASKVPISLSPKIDRVFSDNPSLLKAVEIFARNPFVLVVFPFIFKLSDLGLVEKYFIILVLIVYGWIFVTTFIEPFRCLGEGFLYAYPVAFPIAYLAGSLFVSFKQIVSIPVLVIAILPSLLVVYLSYKNIKNGKRMGLIDKDLEEITDYLKELPRDNVMCFPVALAEFVTYITGKKVLWGGHSSGFKELEVFFPILKEKVEYFIHNYGINYVLVDNDYVTIEDFMKNKNMISLIKQKGKYSLYEIRIS
ncbi:hypothetical protein KAW18_01660 [candidate division WOR-3 bacterium]|nr:hypothetical protein [candidate division WOR-3 bacterium]